MKVVILAGGYGTRLAEYTNDIPKPMVKIGKEPILTHIMRFFSSFGCDNFIIAAGYKQEVILDYYKDSIRLQKEFPNLEIVDTGKDTMTGGRILRLKSYFSENENFFVTYGDGLSDVNLNTLITNHKKLKTLVTLTAVKAPPRFGNLKIDKNKIKRFTEKDPNANEWINGGFMVMEPKIFDFIKSDEDSLEFDALENLGSKGLLGTYKHSGFWKCMDSLKDKVILNNIWNSKKVPWKR